MNDYEHLLELMKTRRTIRRFKENPVGRDDILKLIESARWAPSNHNRQAWKFIVFEDREFIRRLAEHVKQSLEKRVDTGQRLPEEERAAFIHHACSFASALGEMVISPRF